MRWRRVCGTCGRGRPPTSTRRRSAASPVGWPAAPSRVRARRTCRDGSTGRHRRPPVAPRPPTDHPRNVDHGRGRPSPADPGPAVPRRTWTRHMKRRSARPRRGAVLRTPHRVRPRRPPAPRRARGCPGAARDRGRRPVPIRRCGSTCRRIRSGRATTTCGPTGAARAASARHRPAPRRAAWMPRDPAGCPVRVPGAGPGRRVRLHRRRRRRTGCPSCWRSSPWCCWSRSSSCSWPCERGERTGSATTAVPSVTTRSGSPAVSVHAPRVDPDSDPPDRLRAHSPGADDRRPNRHLTTDPTSTD